MIIKSTHKNSFASAAIRFVLLAAIIASWNVAAFGAEPKILIYTKTGKGHVHKNIPQSISCLEKICKSNGWASVASDDPAVFTSENIRTFDVLVFSNTNNETFDTPEQKEVFKQYIHNGGGFVGIHSACGSERKWPWFWANLGFVKFASKDGIGNFQCARTIVHFQFHQIPYALTDGQMMTLPPRDPGTAPFTNRHCFSASTLTTSRFCAVRRTDPMCPAIRLPLNTRPGVWF